MLNRTSNYMKPAPTQNILFSQFMQSLGETLYKFHQQHDTHVLYIDWHMNSLDPNCMGTQIKLYTQRVKRKTYKNSMSFLTFAGRGNVPDHGNILANLGDLIGLGRNPQNGVAFSNVTPFTK